MKVKDEDLINFYLQGVELSLDDAPFPLWFEFYEEKLACLMGYNDATMNVVKIDNKDILSELKGMIS